MKNTHYNKLKVYALTHFINSPTFSISAQSPLQIRHINVINVNNGKVNTNRIVTIEGNRIASIKKDNGNGFVTKAQVDGTNKYLIPGLWDMHYHSGSADQSKNAIFPLMLANGITGVRNMFGTKDDLVFRDSIRLGLLIAPRMVVGSPLVDGVHSTFSTAVKTDNPKRIPIIIDSLHVLGYDFIKSYEFIDNDVFHTIAKYCKSHNIEFAGHTPIGLSVEDASKEGMRSIEHLTGVNKAFSLAEDSLNRIMTIEASQMKNFIDFVKIFFQNEYYNYPFDQRKQKR